MQEDFRKRLLSGEKFDCPCCDRYTQLYQRKIHYSMAWKLIKFFKCGAAEDYMPTSTISSKTGPNDFTLLRYWGLIERKSDCSPGDPESGFWRITELGVQYIRNQARLPYIALVFNDTVLEFSERLASITDALAEKFDYQELMEGLC